MGESLGALGGITFLILVIIAILWILVPFLIMGVSKRLDKLNKNLVHIGKILKKWEERELN